MLVRRGRRAAQVLDPPVAQRPEAAHRARSNRTRSTRWRVTATDWRTLKLYNKSHEISEHVLRETSTGEAPWYVVEGADERYRNLTVGKILLDALRGRWSQAARAPARVRPLAPAPSVIDNVKLIATST